MATRNGAMKKLLAILLLASAQVPAFAAEPLCPALISPSMAEASENAVTFDATPPELTFELMPPEAAALATDAPEATAETPSNVSLATAKTPSNISPVTRETPEGVLIFTGSSPELAPEAGQPAPTAQKALPAGVAEDDLVTGKVWGSTPDGFAELRPSWDAEADFLEQKALDEIAENEATGAANTTARDAYCQFISQDTATN